MRRRSPRRWLLLALVLLLLPVPWRHVADSAVGIAWGMDGRLVLGDERLDPPGQWSWLTVGRPALVGELLWARARQVVDADAPPAARDIRTGSITSRPARVESVAAAVGLQRAGVDVALSVQVVVSSPLVDGVGWPERTSLTHVNGVALVDRAAWHEALRATGPDGRLTFRTAGGVQHVAPGPELPYARIELVDLAPAVRAAVGGHGPPYSWIRSMSMGSSHGLIVGLTTYAAVSGEDLAAGRHIAGTGRLFGDGTVGTIGGLASKAGAARRQGADVLVVPAPQVDQLEGVDTGGMQVLAVTTIDDAIEQLRRTATTAP